MSGLDRDTVFVALTRPQTFAGVSYTVVVMNAMLTTELFLLFKSPWVLAGAVFLHAGAWVAALREPRIFRHLAGEGLTLPADADLVAVAMQFLSRMNARRGAWRSDPAGGDRLPYQAQIDDHTVLLRDGNRTAIKQGSKTTLASYTYNADGRLLASGTATALKYDFTGHRLVETISGGGTHYLFSGDGQLLAEHTTTGTLVRNYVYLDGQPFAIVDGSGNVSYVLNDQVGQPQKMLNSSGTVAWQRISGIFGDTVAQPVGTTSANPQRFPGQQYDAASATHYNFMRDYDPGTGRYLESDPIGLKAGANTYAYVDGDPVGKWDFLGLCESSDKNKCPSGKSETFDGDATYYNLKGKKTAYGGTFNPDTENAAMYQPGKIHKGDVVIVQRRDSSSSVTVTVNDTGPFLRGADGKAVHPLQSDPQTVIDLTPQAFKDLNGSLKAGRVPVTVTKCLP